MVILALIAALVSGIEVRAEAPSLRLDRAARAGLTFHAPPGPLQVECSAGWISDLRETAPGEWRAEWRAPRSRVPQVAIVVARSGEAVGFVALPLSGDGEADVRTRPGAVVSVRIGEGVFGPIRAGPDGKAFVPVVVPPGVDFADQGQRRIDLRIPRTRTVQLGPQPEVPVDRDREVELAVVAVTRAGLPLEHAALELSASHGELGAPVPVAPGLYRVLWRVPVTAPGLALIRASMPGDPEPSEIAVRLVPGGPARISLRAAHDSAEAGGPAIELEAVAQDAVGNPSEHPLTFSAPAGVLSSTRIAPGHHRVTFLPPRSLEGRDALTVTAAPARGEEGPTASLRIGLSPSTAAGVEVVPESTAVRADGRKAVRIRVVVRDRFGNEVSQPPELSTDSGSLGPAEQEGSAFFASYVPPLRHDQGAAIVTARAGGLEGRARVILTPPPHALGLGLRTGWLTNLKGLNAPLLGLDGALRREISGVELALVLGASWASARDNAAVGASTLDARDDFLIFTAAGAFRMPLSARDTFWAQAGVVAVAAAATVRLGGAARGDATSRGAVPGFELVVGAERRMWGGAPFLEARFLRTLSFALPNLDGALTALAFCAGYRFEML